jgi:hypothetical protein
MHEGNTQSEPNCYTSFLLTSDLQLTYILLLFTGKNLKLINTVQSIYIIIYP